MPVGNGGTQVPGKTRRTVVLAMTGPDFVTQAKDWPEFKREWRETFAEHASEAGVAFRFVDDVPTASGEAGTIVVATVDDYRIVGIGARVFFGVMTGNAFINSKVKYISLKDGAVIGEQSYDTTSSAWGGVFSKVTPQQVDQIAAKVFQQINSNQ